VRATTKRQVVLALLAVSSLAVVYRYWLVVPVLHRISVVEWRFIAILVALAIGVGFSRLRLFVWTLMLASAIGLFVGGTWAAWAAPNDARISLLDAFASHVQTCWPDTTMWVVAIVAGGLITGRVLNRYFS
jgi:hypothetical protein